MKNITTTLVALAATTAVSQAALIASTDFSISGSLDTLTVTDDSGSAGITVSNWLGGATAFSRGFEDGGEDGNVNGGGGNLAAKLDGTATTALGVVGTSASTGSGSSFTIAIDSTTILDLSSVTFDFRATKIVNVCNRGIGRTVSNAGRYDRSRSAGYSRGEFPSPLAGWCDIRI